MAAFDPKRTLAHFNERTLSGGVVHHAQKMFGVLPILLACHGVVAISRLRQIAIMIVFLLQLVLVTGSDLLTALRMTRIAGEIGP
jgi:hypothetical protein